MAVDFNGTTSQVVNATAAALNVSLLTICVWEFSDGLGEGGAGVLYTQSEGEDSFSIFHGVANQKRFFQRHATTNGTWSWPALDGKWNAMSVSIDRSTTPASLPLVRVNFAPVTVTVVAAPVGAPTLGTTGYCIGAINGGVQAWDGAIAQVQVFNRILTDIEKDDALINPGTVSDGRVLWLHLCSVSDLLDYSGNGSHGTGTALTERDPPSSPCAPASASNLSGQALL